MASARGCLKTSLIGCGLVLAAMIAFTAVIFGIAMSGGGSREEVEQAADAVAAAQASATTVADPEALTRTHPGRLVLDLAQGAFSVQPAEPGEGLVVRAEFDQEVHTLTRAFAVAPDSSWTALVSLRRTMPALQALLRQVGGKDTDATITVFVPADVPVELVIAMEQGGGEVELGGLWLRTADLTVRQGGFELSCRDPLREPIARLRLDGRMGGVQATGLGNLSPRILDVACGMGGADLDMGGAWLNDCDARFRARLGGLSVRLPRDLDIEASGPLPDDLTLPTLRRTDLETPLPVLRVQVDQSMGGVEISR